MEFDDRLRSEVTAALWEINKRAYVKIFEEKYREEMYSKATEEANARNSEIIRNLRDQVADLSKQVEQSKIVMESRETPVSERAPGVVVYRGLRPPSDGDAPSHHRRKVQGLCARDTRDTPYRYHPPH